MHGHTAVTADKLCGRALARYIARHNIARNCIARIILPDFARLNPGLQLVPPPSARAGSERVGSAAIGKRRVLLDTPRLTPRVGESLGPISVQAGAGLVVWKRVVDCCPRSLGIDRSRWGPEIRSQMASGCQRQNQHQRQPVETLFQNPQEPELC